MEAYEQYSKTVTSILSEVLASQKNEIKIAAKELAKRVVREGIIHLFGTGHSHMIVEEAFFRAGGLACTNAMLEPNLMLHHGAEQSSWLEKVEGFASVILDKYRVKAEDAVIIISNSGRNAVPIEMAIEAKKRGLYTIGLTSLQYKNEPSRHSSGKKLFEIADMVIDNGSVIGDAVVEMGGGMKMGPTSTVVGAALVNGLLVQTAEELKTLGKVPPIIQSVNVDTQGAVERNRELIEHYSQRVRLF
ncbi:sugar isomerase domain-containing protein [Aneurinibacillus terranovensis]|uniref:sugar isomerase domain-containing protein n=1 Tax=Aneurinibacillus terranovensis TaxID=278991 RepID=UPI0003F52629|nr:SIS domain-containing protein [Aneurinibacillus terranovensis]